MSKLAILAALAVAALAPVAAFADGTNAGTETVTAGPVSATLSWDAGEDGPLNARLRISRSGTIVFDRAIQRVCGEECLRDASDTDGFALVDLKGDGEPEVIATGDNSGRCCTTMGIYGFDPATGTYGELVREWGDAIVEFKDVHHNGSHQIVTTDERFQNLVPGNSTIFFPPRVFAYEGTGAGAKLIDRTRTSLSVVRDEAALTKFLVDELKKPDVYAKLYVGSYVADEYLLGRGSVGLRALDRATKRGLLGKPASAKKFRKRLLTLLDRYGYR
jgi:hypothetical protein